MDSSPALVRLPSHTRLLNTDTCPDASLITPLIASTVDDRSEIGARIGICYAVSGERARSLLYSNDCIIFTAFGGLIGSY